MISFNDLTPQQVDELIRRYYRGESAKSLIAEYELDVHPRLLYSLFPPEVIEEVCEYCGTNLVKTRESRASLSGYRRIDNKSCPICQHRPNASPCTCENCQKKARLRLVRLRNAIRNKYDVEYSPIVYSELGFKDKVYLGALIQTAVNEDLYHVIPYVQTRMDLSPTAGFNREIYNTLIDKKIIVVDPSSPLECFDTKSDRFPEIFYIYKVKYNLNLFYPDNKNDLMLEIINPQYYDIEISNHALEMWKKIAINECLEYLEYQLAKVRFDYSPGEKTITIFTKLLKDYSVSQIYAIIWHCISAASRDFQERRMSRLMAGNSVVSRCLKFGERAKLSNWDIKEYSRIRDLPQSEISSYFFNQVIRIGDNGFYHKPNLVDLGIAENPIIENNENDLA